MVTKDKKNISKTLNSLKLLIRSENNVAVATVSYHFLGNHLDFALQCFCTEEAQCKKQNFLHCAFSVNRPDRLQADPGVTTHVLCTLVSYRLCVPSVWREVWSQPLIAACLRINCTLLKKKRKRKKGN